MCQHWLTTQGTIHIRRCVWCNKSLDTHTYIHMCKWLWYNWWIVLSLEAVCCASLWCVSWSFNRWPSIGTNFHLLLFMCIAASRLSTTVFVHNCRLDKYTFQHECLLTRPLESNLSQRMPLHGCRIACPSVARDFKVMLRFGNISVLSFHATTNNNSNHLMQDIQVC